MSDFNEFLNDLKSGISILAETTFSDFKDQALAAGLDFLEQSKDDLKLWTEQMATGQLSEEDFEWQLKSKKDLAELTLLKQKGLAKAKVDKFTNGVFEVIISSAVKRFTV